MVITLISVRTTTILTMGGFERRRTGFPQYYTLAKVAKVATVAKDFFSNENQNFLKELLAK